MGNKFEILNHNENKSTICDLPFLIFIFTTLPASPLFTVNTQTGRFVVAMRQCLEASILPSVLIPTPSFKSATNSVPGTGFPGGRVIHTTVENSMMSVASGFTWSVTAILVKESSLPLRDVRSAQQVSFTSHRSFSPPHPTFIHLACPAIDASTSLSFPREVDHLVGPRYQILW